MKKSKRLLRRNNEGFIEYTYDGYFDEKAERTEDAKVFEKLCDLEDKIENRTLIELPCKIGDIIYYANPYCDLLKIRKFKVTCISITATYIRIICCNAENEHDISNYYFSSDEINFTEAEAEAKWRKLLKENPQK